MWGEEEFSCVGTSLLLWFTCCDLGQTPTFSRKSPRRNQESWKPKPGPQKEQSRDVLPLHAWLTQLSLAAGLGLGPGWRMFANEASGFQKMKIISQFSLLEWVIILKTVCSGLRVRDCIRRCHVLPAWGVHRAGGKTKGRRGLWILYAPPSLSFVQRKMTSKTLLWMKVVCRVEAFKGFSQEELAFGI